MAVLKNETVKKLILMNQQKDQVIASLTKSLEEEKPTNSTLLAIISGAGLRSGGGENSLQRTCGGKGEANVDMNSYCWLHGYKVEMGHSSMTCNKQLNKHKKCTTCANRMGGKKYNKDWKPQA
ncbi:hypothetical protein ACHAW6_008930 [Cyclotella cf. meneghiniana]